VQNHHLYVKSLIDGHIVYDLKTELDEPYFDKLCYLQNELFKSYHGLLEPGIEICIPYKSIELSINFGYTFQFIGTDLLYSKNDDLKLIKRETRKNIKAQWNGYKIGMTIYYNFDFKRTRN